MAIKHALVVDDSKAAGLALRQMLEHHRVAVDIADSAESAFVYLRNQKPDVIFMDHIMPGMNGLEAAKTITANPQTAGIPIIMYTSTEGPTYPEKARAHGAVGVLPKPPKSEVLAQFLRQLSAAEGVEIPTARTGAKPVPPTAEPSTETIDIIARKAAEAVVRNGVQTLVTRLVDEQVARVRDELLTRSESLAKQVATEVQHTRVAELVDLLRKHVQDQLTSIQERLDGVATAGAPAAPSAAVDLEEVKRLAYTVAAEAAADTASRTLNDGRASVLDAARQIAHEAAAAVAQRVGADVANDTADTVARQLVRELLEARTHALAAELQTQIDARLATIHARLDIPAAPAGPSIDELTRVAKSVAAHEAAAIATQAARDIAQRAAADAAERAAADIARRVADEQVTARVDTLSAQLHKEVHHQLADVRAHLQELSQPAEKSALPRNILTEVKNVARAAAAQKAFEAAHGAVQDIAQQIGKDIARQATLTAQEQIASQSRLMYLLAGGAAAIGVATTLLVHFVF